MRHFLVAIVFWGGLQLSISSVIPGSVFALASSPAGASPTPAAAPAKPAPPAKSGQNREARTKDTAAKGAPAKATQAQRPSPQRPAQQSAARPAPKSSQPPVVRKPATPSPIAKKPATGQKKVVRDPANVMSAGTRLGLRSALSDVALNSSAVMVIDQISGEVLIEKNPDAVLPIASITKLMTALVVLDAGLPLEELITITKEDADLEKNPVSRLPVGARFTRGELMHLSLMSSENRAAHALGRTYPGGMRAFVAAMNIKALKIGMTQARFTEPTGLNNGNVASPRDLVRLVEESYLVPEIREYSTSRDLMVRVRGRPVQFMNSNALARGEDWDLGVSKTGFIRDAGRCLVMQADFESRPVIMVMLDAQGKQHRERDAQRIREFILQQAGEGRTTGGA
nr:D-alanyl-D-alanine endopeptidase [Cupriavidus sp.]